MSMSHPIPNGISQEIIAYITYRDLPALFDFDPNNDFNAYPTPRSWEMVDKYIKMLIYKTKYIRYINTFTYKILQINVSK